MALLEQMENDTGYERITKNSSQKVLQMLKILKEYNPEVMNKPGGLYCTTVLWIVLL